MCNSQEPDFEVGRPMRLTRKGWKPVQQVFPDPDIVHCPNGCGSHWGIANFDRCQQCQAFLQSLAR